MLLESLIFWNLHKKIHSIARTIKTKWTAFLLIHFFAHLSWPTHQFVLNCTFHPVKPVFPFSDNWPASKPYTLHQLHHSLVTVLQMKPPRKVCDPIRENKHRTVIARLRCSFEQEREIEDAIKCFCNWQPNGTHQGASWMFLRHLHWLALALRTCIEIEQFFYVLFRSSVVIFTLL